MKRFIAKQVAGGFLVVLGTCGIAQADPTYTYTYSYGWTVPNACTGSWMNSCTMSGGTRNLVSSTPGAPADPNLPAATISSTATGWSNTGGNANTLNGNQTLEQGQVQAWNGTGGNGLGIRNNDYQSGEDTNSSYDVNEGGTPEHAVDNQQRYDSMLYSFGSSIALSNVSISYAGGAGYLGQSYDDADIIVLAYNSARGGAWDQATKLAGQTYANLVSLGWDLIGNYTGLSAGASKAINAGGASSSYWLIGAANTLVSGGTNDAKNDYMKLAALGGTITTQNSPPPPPGVPEPGSLALLALGSALLVRARAKR